MWRKCPLSQHSLAIDERKLSGKLLIGYFGDCKGCLDEHFTTSIEKARRSATAEATREMSEGSFLSIISSIFYPSFFPNNLCYLRKDTILSLFDQLSVSQHKMDPSLTESESAFTAGDAPVIKSFESRRPTSFRPAMNGRRWRFDGDLESEPSLDTLVLATELSVGQKDGLELSSTT
ncbi:hypothetical protein KIN20_014733 [Parelaphostrongylus tenuis]|uniref:Uncharacterized protein n=1 Tax=Parelaphostrongylus tenuis TaxID=148309 RepID=A0AAD5MZU8_PARTN|nr:hypothetical protein KIN20_014733 [Parelaphostrongylus tenuis]